MRTFISRITLLALFSGTVSVIEANWEILALPTDRGFTAIWAINEQIIFTTGHQGLWTTFDGIEWKLDTNYRPSHIYFVDDTLGFLSSGAITTNGGRTWQEIVDGMGSPISFPKGQSLIGYGVGYDDVRKTVDGGWHWNTVGTLPITHPDIMDFIDTREICFPSDFDTGYVTARFGDNDAEIYRYSYYKTTDSGQTWTLNEEAFFNDDFKPYLMDFPQNPSIGYMAGGGKVFKTTDGGASWDTVLVDTSMSMNDMTFPETDQWGYVIGTNKAYRTLDGGASWQHYEFGGDTILARCHFVDNRLGFITGINNVEYCMPYDPGFVLKTTDGLLGISEDDWVDVDPSLLEISTPAIFTREVTISFSVKEPGRLEAMLYDATGRQVQSHSWHNATCGNSSLTFDGANLPSGVYFILVEFCFTQGNQTQTLRTVKVR